MSQKRSIGRGVISLISYLIVLSQSAAIASDASARDSAKASALTSFSEPAFLENRGQWPESVEFLSMRRGWKVALTMDGIWIDGPSAVDVTRRARVRIGFPECAAGAMKREKPQGMDSLPGPRHFFLGADPAQWATDARAYQRVKYDGIAPGIGIELIAGGGNGLFTYDLECAAGADLDALVFAVEGARSLRIDDAGHLVADTELGDLRQAPPRAWREDAAGNRVSVPSAFRILGPTAFGFEVPELAAGERLVIDPEVIIADIIGQGFDIEVGAVTEDAIGRMVIAGRTDDASFPTTPGAFQTTLDPGNVGFTWEDTFVVAYDLAKQEIAFATYVGGDKTDFVIGMVGDPSGDIVFGGWTGSTDFPTTSGAFQPAIYGPVDGYICALRSDGAALSFSTYIGGSYAELPTGMTRSAGGGWILVGTTFGTNFPVTPTAYQKTIKGKWDGFVTVISPDGSSLLASTLIGGTDLESGGPSWGDVCVADDGDILLAIQTGSSDFPTTPGALQQSKPVGTPAALARFSSDLSTLVASTYVGNSLQSAAVTGVDIGPDDCPVVVGYGASSDYPVTPGAFSQPHIPSEGGIVVTKYAPDLSALQYSIHLMNVLDRCRDVVVDDFSAAITTGWVEHGYLPTTEGCLDSTYGAEGGINSKDGFVMRVSPDGADLWYSTFLGSWSGDEPEAIALSRTGAVIVGGWTGIGQFYETVEPLHPRQAKFVSAFGIELSLMPKGTERVGLQSPWAGGWPVIGVTRKPSVRRGLEITCSGVPKSAPGLLVVGPSKADVLISVNGARLYIAPQNLAFFAVTSDAHGTVRLPLDVSHLAAGDKGYAQFFFAEPNTNEQLCATAALEVVFAP